MQVPIIGDDVIFNLLPYKKAQDKALHFLHTQTRNVIEARREDLKKMNIKSICGSDDIGKFGSPQTTELPRVVQSDWATIRYGYIVRNQIFGWVCLHGM